MLTTIEPNFYLCPDCVSAVLGCPTGLSLYYSEDEVDAILEQASVNLKALPGDLFAGDSELDLEFSRCSCDLCGSDLAGHRLHCVILGEL